jgi:site-specific DNA-methyltransferase (adenine-specific)
MNKLFYGDNLEILRRDIDKNSIDLCYIDPPFNSKRNYNQIYNNIGTEDKAQAQAFIDTWEWDDYADDGFHQILNNANNVFTKQSIELISGLSKVLGKGSLLAYLVHMTLRIAEIYRVLKPTGSFYLHCDPTASHYLKLVLDAVFCAGRKGQFQNEIIWHYRRWTGKAAKFQELHDVIFFYTKNDTYTFNVQYTEYTEKSLKRKQNYHTRIKGDDVYVTQIDERGVRDNDVWQIQLLNSQSNERLGYPTQKPEALLEKIIAASTQIGDTVLDAYCGCGTTVSVAERLKRKWIGIDITYQSISLILKRLEDTFGKSVIENVELNGIPKDIESAVALANKKDDRVRKEFEKWAVLTYSNNKALINEKKGADHGIDGIAYIMEGNELFRDVLFSVKSGHSSLSQFRDFCHVVKRDEAAMGIFITLDEPTKQMNAEAAKMGKYVNPLTEQKYDKVSIVTIQQMLEGERLNIPTSIDVLKKADLKKNNNQSKLEF